MFLNILFYTVKEVMKMLTYKTLYHLMVRSMSEAIDLYDAGKGILAREVMQKALLDAEEQVIAHDIIPDEPVGSADSAENTGNDRQGLMAKPCTPHLHCAACAVLRAANLQCRGSRGTPLAFLWGFKRGYSLLRKRIPPLTRQHLFIRAY